MARSPSWRMTLRPKTVSLATCGWSVARAGSQAVHHGGTLREQEQHDYEDQKEVAQEVGDAGEDGADGPGEGAGTERFMQICFRDPQALGQALDLVQLTVQLPCVGSDVPAEPGDRDAQDPGDRQEEDASAPRA